MVYEVFMVIFIVMWIGWNYDGLFKGWKFVKWLFIEGWGGILKSGLGIRSLVMWKCVGF